MLKVGSFYWSAVVVNPESSLIEELLARNCPCLQFHGSEDLHLLAAYRHRARIVKALRLDHPRDLQIELPVDEYLLDGVRPGCGQSFDWSWAQQYRPSLPFFLAGGLTPENVALAISVARPDGVDVSSGIELSPGVKCSEKLARFVTAVRQSQL